MFTLKHYIYVGQRGHSTSTPLQCLGQVILNNIKSPFMSNFLNNLSRLSFEILYSKVNGSQLCIFIFNDEFIQRENSTKENKSIAVDTTSSLIKVTSRTLIINY